MDATEQAQKLKQIAELPPLELEDWLACVSGYSELYIRPAFDGEIAALTRRAQVLGMTLSSSASRAALCGSATGTAAQRPSTSPVTSR